MPLKRNIYLRQKNRALSYYMFRGFAVLTILFLFSSQVLQPVAAGQNNQITPQCTLCREINTLCVWSDADGKTHLENCEHCPVFLATDQQYMEQSPVYCGGRKLTEFTRVEFLLQQAMTPEHLRPYRLNSRGPPRPGILFGLLARTTLPAQNVIDVISSRFGGTQWR